MPQARRDFYIREPYVRRVIPEAEVNVTDRWESVQVKYRNSLVSQPLVFGSAYSGGGGSGTFGSGNCGDWMAAVEEMGKWYVSTKTHYVNACVMPECPLLNNAKTRPDCSGFVNSCVDYFLKLPYKPYPTACMIPGSAGYEKLTSNGWTHRRCSSDEDKKMATDARWELLQAGDIVRHCCNGYGSANSGHTYIIGPNRLRYEMGGKNNRSHPCQIPYNDYRDGGAASGKYHSFDIFRR